MGRRAGEIGFKLLSGAHPPDAGDPSLTVAPQPMFSWAQLARWGGADPAWLPADTVFLDRPRTLWTECRNFVLASACPIWC